MIGLIRHYSIQSAEGRAAPLRVTVQASASLTEPYTPIFFCNSGSHSADQGFLHLSPTSVVISGIARSVAIPIDFFVNSSKWSSSGP